MRLIVTGILSLFLAHCGPQTQKAGTRERETPSPENLDGLRALNAKLVENEEAMEGAVAPTRNEKSQKMARALKEAHCGFTRNDARGDRFDVDWSASRVFEGSLCPVKSQREWRYANRNRELVVYHAFATVDPEYRKLNGINKLDGSGSIVVNRDAAGAVRITGQIKYDAFEVDGFGALTAVVQTNQSYRGAKGGGNVTVTITQPGGFTITGGVRWDVRDFARRTYFAGRTSLDRKGFEELFSFFELDKVVDDSERMR